MYKGILEPEEKFQDYIDQFFNAKPVLIWEILAINFPH